jgi:double zinc ribbon protein
MFCPSCKHENRAGRKFCVHCGAGLELACPSCGVRSEPGERFCGECGTNAASLPKTSAIPEPHAPKHIVNRTQAEQSRSRREV